MFESEVRLVKILSNAGVKGRDILFLNFYYIGIPKYYDSFRISDNESVLLMEKLGQCLFEILEGEQRRFFPI
jgi:hypothetical protein